MQATMPYVYRTLYSLLDALTHVIPLKKPCLGNDDKREKNWLHNFTAQVQCFMYLGSILFYIYVCSHFDAYKTHAYVKSLSKHSINDGSFL